MVQAYRADTENGSAEPQRTGSRLDRKSVV